MTTPAISVGSRKQLFIDNKFIEHQQNITLRINPPRKAEPVLVPATDIESHRVGCCCQIFRVGDEWQMIYTAIPKGPFDYDPSKKDGSGYMNCLAASRDGLHWERKNVNLFTIRGQKENNVVFPNAYGCVLVDPRQSGGFRYWYLAHTKQSQVWQESDGCEYHNGLYLFKSNDLIYWQRHPGRALPFYMDTDNQCFFDARINKYVAYLRAWVPGKTRCVSRLEMDDFLELPWPHKPFDPNRQRMMINTIIDEIPVVMQADPGDPPNTDIYTPSVEPYAPEDGVYLAFPVRFRHYDGFNSHGRDLRGRFENDGVSDIALAVSRDGINWHRFKEAYVNSGFIGEADNGCIYMGFGMIPAGNELWQYYFGISERNSFYRQAKPKSALFRTIQRLDGFVSADASMAGGELTTPALRFTGNRLLLNIDCGAMGETWVELQDEQGHPIPGFTLAESVSVDLNGVKQEAWWQQGADVSALAGKPVRLHFKMRAAKLFSFQFAGP